VIGWENDPSFYLTMQAQFGSSASSSPPAYTGSFKLASLEIRDTISFPHTQFSPSITSMTVEAWVRQESNPGSNYLCYICTSDPDLSTTTGYSLLYKSNTELEFRASTNVHVITGLPSLPLSGWHHMAASFDEDYRLAGIGFYEILVDLQYYSSAELASGSITFPSLGYMGWKSSGITTSSLLYMKEVRIWRSRRNL